MNTWKLFFLTIFATGLFFAPLTGNCQETGSGKPELLVFHSLTCHSCIKVKKEIMPEIEMRFKDKIIIEYRDIADIENYKLLVSLQEKHKISLSNDLPIFYIEGTFLNSEEQIGKNWETFINRSLQNTEKDNHQNVAPIDLTSRFKNFRLLTVVGAGLIDGINPCAFTVIVFFISFLALQGYRKKELVAIGLTFIFAVFLTYLLLGLGLFSFLYQLKGFWIITKTINLIIGIFSIILGFLACYDYYKFRKTGLAQEMVLQLPLSVKKQLHKVIRVHLKVDRENREAIQNRSITRLVLSALVTGFLVSLLEAVCTGQTYLPTIIFILKTSPDLKLQALGYLLIFNIMFIVPLLAIFIMALIGVTTKQFSTYFQKHIPAIKILMAVIFFGLGVFLVLKA